jgi:hypothetical protein
MIFPIDDTLAVSGVAATAKISTAQAVRPQTEPLRLIDTYQLCEHLECLLYGGWGRLSGSVLLAVVPSRGGDDARRGVWYYPLDGVLLSAETLAPVAAALAQRPGSFLCVRPNPALPQPADWGMRPEHFSAAAGRAEQERRCAMWREGHPNARRPRQWGAADEHIAGARFVWFEDDGGRSIDEQLAFATNTIGEPTFTIWTGGKSLHCIYRLGFMISAEYFRLMQGLLIRAASHQDAGAKIDGALVNPARLMRVAGGLHASGRRCVVHTYSGITYDPLALATKLRGLCPLPSIAPPVAYQRLAQRSRRSRSDATTLDDMRRHLDRYPPRTGAGNGTYHDDRDVLWGLIRACEEAGYTVDDAIGLMVEHSPKWGRRDIEQVARYEFSRVTAGSFWSLAGAIGGGVS